MTTQRHYIEIQKLELHLLHHSGGNEFVSSAGNRYQEMILPALSDLFDTIVGPDETLQVDILKIDAGLITMNNWESQLVRAIMEGLRLSIDKIKTDPADVVVVTSDETEKPSNVIATDVAIVHQFLFFLRHGHMRSNRVSMLQNEEMANDTNTRHFPEVEDPFERTILSILQQQSPLAQLVHQELSGSAEMIQRIVQQFSQAFYDRLCDFIIPTTAQRQRIKLAVELTDIMENTFHCPNSSRIFSSRRALYLAIGLNQQTEKQRACLNQYLSYLEPTSAVLPSEIGDLFFSSLQQAADSIPSADITESFVAQLAGLVKRTDGSKHESANANLIPTPKHGVKHASPRMADQGDITDSIPQAWSEKLSPPKAQAIYIDNAGIVLLNPFLTAFFNTLGLLDERERFINFNCTVKAIHLLHYLATGTENNPEHLLVLPKILCGVAVETPIARYIELTQEEKDEALDLLHSVIKHWHIIGDTSPDGLRETFLTRSGKLESSQEAITLVVEAKSVDILLEQLPWSISFIRFPWLKKIINIQWSN